MTERTDRIGDQLIEIGDRIDKLEENLKKFSGQVEYQRLVAGVTQWLIEILRLQHQVIVSLDHEVYKLSGKSRSN